MNAPLASASLPIVSPCRFEEDDDDVNDDSWTVSTSGSTIKASNVSPDRHALVS